MSVFIKKLHTKARLPVRKTDGAAGFDLAACIDKPLYMHLHRTYKIPLGFAMEMPNGVMGLIKSRSGTELEGFHASGVIDSDYRGEVNVIARWHGAEGKSCYVIEPGMRIAQLLFIIGVAPMIVEARTLKATARGDGGFGSTGSVDPDADTLVLSPGEAGAASSDVWPDVCPHGFVDGPCFQCAGDTKPIAICPHGNGSECAVCFPVGR